jgi:hypothetical protein
LLDRLVIFVFRKSYYFYNGQIHMEFFQCLPHNRHSFLIANSAKATLRNTLHHLILHDTFYTKQD